MMCTMWYARKFVRDRKPTAAVVEGMQAYPTLDNNSVYIYMYKVSATPAALLMNEAIPISDTRMMSLLGFDMF